ncbi:MAG: YetF domain-containing protein, partial [Oscillospiraceae bacterium]
LICGSPTALILDGKVQQDAMRHNRFTLDELIEELRSQGVTSAPTVVRGARNRWTALRAPLSRRAARNAKSSSAARPSGTTPSSRTSFINDGRVMGENLSLAGLRQNAWLQKAGARTGLPRIGGYLSASQLDGAGNILCIGKDSAK